MRDAARALAQLMESGAMGNLVGASVSIRWWRP
jgi:hypothetical protein